jgi:hypothetical protein
MLTLSRVKLLDGQRYNGWIEGLQEESQFGVRLAKRCRKKGVGFENQ